MSVNKTCQLKREFDNNYLEMNETNASIDMRTMAKTYRNDETNNEEHDEHESYDERETGEHI